MRGIVFVYGMRKKKEKTSKQLERHLKGVSNYRRIEVLLLLAGRGQMTLDEIQSNLDCHMATASEHVAKLFRAGLVGKAYKGRSVIHELSPYGKIFVKFLRSFGHIKTL